MKKKQQLTPGTVQSSGSQQHAQVKQKKRKASKIHNYTPLQQQHGRGGPVLDTGMHPMSAHQLDQVQPPLNFYPAGPQQMAPMQPTVQDQGAPRKRFHGSQSSTKTGANNKSFNKMKLQQGFLQQQPFSFSAQGKQKKMVYRVKEQKRSGHPKQETQQQVNPTSQSQQKHQEFNQKSPLLDFELCQPQVMMTPSPQQFNGNMQSLRMRPDSLPQQNMFMPSPPQMPFFAMPPPPHATDMLFQNFMQQQTASQDFKNCKPLRKQISSRSDFQFSNVKQSAYQPLRSNPVAAKAEDGSVAGSSFWRGLRPRTAKVDNNVQTGGRTQSESNVAEQQMTPPSLKVTQQRASSETGAAQDNAGSDNSLKLQKFKSQQDGASSQHMPLRIKHQTTAPPFKPQADIFEYKGDSSDAFKNEVLSEDGNIQPSSKDWLASPSKNEFQSFADLQVTFQHDLTPDQPKQSSQRLKARTAEKKTFLQHHDNASMPINQKQQMITQPFTNNGQNVTNSNKPPDSSLNSSSMLTSFSRSISSNHELSANCLRKCTQWQLQLHDGLIKQHNVGAPFKPTTQKLTLEQVSGIAVRQMNYVQFEANLSKEEINNRKKLSRLPTSPLPYQQDIIDEMMAFEDQLIFNQQSQEFHDKGCKGDENCCQVKIKKFNKYVRSAYEDQQIELPFNLSRAPPVGQPQRPLSTSSQNGYGTDDFDMVSQMSSQLSEQSRTSFQYVPQTQANEEPCLIPPAQYNDMPLRDQMTMFGSVRQAENMFCLEFDLRDCPIHGPEDDEQIKLNRSFRVINQSMIESIMHFKLRGNCHGHSLFFPAEIALNFNVSGKKIIKSIQSRILSLKHSLAEAASAMALPRTQMQVPTHVRQNPEKLQKFYLNSIEKNNAAGVGPWVTKTKRSMLIKLLNYQGRSLGFQIAMPQLDNLPNQMSNFNQLVLQELEIEKIFICFDMPLSRINRPQACNIDDLDNYLIAKSIQPQLPLQDSLAHQQQQTQQNALLAQHLHQFYNQNLMINSPQPLLSQPNQQHQFQTQPAVMGATSAENVQKSQSSSKDGSTPMNLLDEFLQFNNGNANDPISGQNYSVDGFKPQIDNFNCMPSATSNNLIQSGIDQCVLPDSVAMMQSGPFIDGNMRQAAAMQPQHQQHAFQVQMQGMAPIGQEAAHLAFNNNQIQFERVFVPQQPNQHLTTPVTPLHHQTQQFLLFNQAAPSHPHLPLAPQVNQAFVPPPFAPGQFIPHQFAKQQHQIPSAVSCDPFHIDFNQQTMQPSSSVPHVQQASEGEGVNSDAKSAAAPSTASSAQIMKQQTNESRATAAAGHKTSKNNSGHLPTYDVHNYFKQAASKQPSMPARLQGQLYTALQGSPGLKEQQKYYNEQLELLQQQQMKNPQTYQYFNLINGQHQMPFQKAQQQIGAVSAQGIMQQPMLGVVPSQQAFGQMQPVVPHHQNMSQQASSIDGNSQGQQSVSEATGAPPNYIMQSSMSSQAMAGVGGSFNTALPTLVKPGMYNIDDFLRDDRNQMCNLDRFVVATMPVDLNINTNSLLDLIRGYHMASVRGITVEMTDVTSTNDNSRLLFTFMPTLSSLLFYTKQQPVGAQASAASSSSGDRVSDRSTNSMTTNNRISKIIEFHEELLPYKRKPLSLSMLDQCKGLMLPPNAKHSMVKALEQLLLRTRRRKNSFSLDDQEDTLSSLESSDSSSDEAEDGPGGNNAEDFINMHQIENNQPSIREQIDTEHSFFSILWTCQQSLPSESKAGQSAQFQQPEAKQQSMAPGAPQNIQFFVIYKFAERSAADNWNDEQDKSPTCDLQIVGIQPYKLEREDFWVTPGRMQSENEMQGQLFDEVCDSNIDLLGDLQHKAIKFMQDGGMAADSNDFQFFYKQLQMEHIVQTPAQVMQPDQHRFGANQFAADAEAFIQQMAAMDKRQRDQQVFDNWKQRR